MTTTPDPSVTRIEVGDVELAVHEWGGDGRPLLLCHATGFHARVWDGLVAAFPDRRCIALDFRGYGDSTAPPDGRFTWHDFGDDVLAVVDRFDLHEVQAIGHSKGGAALLLAELVRPGTFDRLVCYEPIVFPNDPTTVPGGDVNPLADSARRRRDHFESPEAAIERFASKPPLGALRRDVLEAYVHHGFRPADDGGIVLKADREHEARTYEMGSQLGAFDRLPGVGCPVLVACGDDGGPPAVFAPRIVEQLPHARLHVFAGLGHFGPLEDPDAVAEVARDFFAEA